MRELILPHQRSAFEQLLSTARAYFSTAWHDLPLRPRWSQLIVSPTGTGKSHIARAVARACRAHFFPVNLGSWIPTGASRQQGRQTVQSLVESVVGNPFTIVLVDEIDKLSDDTSWTTYLRAELYALLDGNWPTGTVFADENDEHASTREGLARWRLRHRCWFIAAGTWQSLWSCRNTPHIGFLPHAEDTSMPTASELADSIPRETLNRFGSSILMIPPMTAADLNAAIAVAASELPEHLEARFAAAATKRIPAAIQNQSSCRVLEETLAQLLIDDDIAMRRPASPEIEPS